MVVSPQENVTASSINVTVLLTNGTTFVEKECSSEEYYLQDVIVKVDNYASPLIYVLGFPGNLFSLLIWIRPRMRQSSGIYLIALALDDLAVLSLHTVLNYGYWTLDTPVLCEAFAILFLATQYLDPLLVLGFTVERFIAVCFPFKRKQYCTIKRANLVTCFLALFSLAICGFQGYVFTTGADGKCDIREEISVGRQRSLLHIWIWMTESLMFIIVPFLVLVLNVLVIQAIRRTSAVHQNTSSGCRNRSTTTVMLLSVSFYFILTTLPCTLVYVLLKDSDVLACASSRTNLLRTVSDEIGLTHFAYNFYIYMITGKLFRVEFKRLFTSKFYCKQELR